MQPDQQGVFFQLIIQGGGEFTYDASGNLRSSNVGAVSTDPIQGITCPQGFATYNGHGAVLSLLSTSASSAGFFQYFDNGSAVQGQLILAVASASGSDPVNGTGYVAGLNGIDPAFGDVIVVVGATITMGIGTVLTRTAGIKPQQAADVAHSPYLEVDGPEETTAKHLQMLLLGASPDGTTRPGATLLVAAVAGAAVAAPATNAVAEVQGTASQTALELVPTAAANQVLATRISADTFDRGQIDGNFGHNWGSGAAGTDSSLHRLAANSMSFKNCDLSVETIGRGLRVREGTNAKQGTATLTAGSVTVANTAVTASSRIVPMYVTPSANAGAVFASSITAGTGFTLKSTNAADTSVVGYQIYEPA